MQTAPLISLENITVRLHDRPYLHNTSWQIHSNENWAVLGPNGSGKTSFARTLLGQVPIVSGRIRYRFSEDDHQNWASVAGQMGYVAPELQREIFARENRKDFFRELSGKRQEFTSVKDLILNQAAGDVRQVHHDKRLREVAEKIGIHHLLGRDVTSLTSGEMNRALIAGALFKIPRLLILDEPFAGLDEPTRRSLTDTINTLVQTKVQLILITHRFDEIVPSITHVVLLKQGQIYKAGEKDAVFRPETIEQAYELDRPALQLDPQALFNAPPGSAAMKSQTADRIPSAGPRVLIEMKKVTVQYGSRLILDGFNWKVEDGENWLIRGPSAAGKSTVLALINGDNLQAYANDICLFGQKRGAGQSIWDIREKIGHISSDLQLRQHQHTDAFEVVCSGFFASNGLYRKCSAGQLAVADAWSRFLGIDDLADQKFGRLSHGQRQLVLLARAMVKSPVFLILDEPLQGLDIKNKAKLRNVFDYIGYHTPTNLIYVPDQETKELNCITHVLQMERGKAIQTRSLGNENAVHRDTH
ncbi:MAG: ATP-binding cassette domain-containing protein [Desulfobacterales bacterium]|jgi:molybdate transport system ATP-binding protein